ncbi:MAG TPA: transposase [Fimbriimonas sp.]|nr:transposase [Fimbriimonas sp.]
MMRTWPNAPSRAVDLAGTYIITAGTYHKVKLFNTDAKLDLLQSVLLESLATLGWELQAWAVFQNHYHFVGRSPEEGLGLTRLTNRVHGISARSLNESDQTPGRRVWYRSWDTRISYKNSYLARLSYVHNNPVRHGLVADAKNYPWCSANWLFLNAEPAHYETIMGIGAERVNVYDDFD